MTRVYRNKFNSSERWTGHPANEMERMHPRAKWPEVTWDDLKAVWEAVPESPEDRYIITMFGMWSYSRPELKVKGAAFVKSNETMNYIFNNIMKTRSWQEISFHEQAQFLFDMHQEPDKIVGWSVKHASLSRSS